MGRPSVGAMSCLRSTSEKPAWSCLPSIMIWAGRELSRCRCGNACRRRDRKVSQLTRGTFGENVLKNVFYFEKEDYKELEYETRELKCCSASVLPAEFLVICPCLCVLASTFTALLMQNSSQKCAALSIPETQTPGTASALCRHFTTDKRPLLRTNQTPGQIWNDEIHECDDYWGKCDNSHHLKCKTTKLAKRLAC